MLFMCEIQINAQLLSLVISTATIWLLFQKICFAVFLNFLLCKWIDQMSQSLTNVIIVAMSRKILEISILPHFWNLLSCLVVPMRQKFNSRRQESLTSIKEMWFSFRNINSDPSCIFHKTSLEGEHLYKMFQPLAGS